MSCPNGDDTLRVNDITEQASTTVCTAPNYAGWSVMSLTPPPSLVYANAVVVNSVQYLLDSTPTAAALLSVTVGLSISVCLHIWSARHLFSSDSFSRRLRLTGDGTAFHRVFVIDLTETM